MRILIIHNILWSHYKSVLFEALEKYKNKDSEIIVLHIAKNEISRKSMEGALFNYNYKYELLYDDYIENISSVKKIFGVINFIRKFNPDLVNVHGFGIDISITISIIYSFLIRKKVVISSESTILDNRKNFLKDLIKKNLLRMSSGFVTFGHSSKLYLLSLGVENRKIIEDKAAIVDDTKIKEIFQYGKNPTIDIQSKITTKHNFIFIGRFLGIKNISILISAFQKIKAKHPMADDWGLVLVGDGEERINIEKKISASPKGIHVFGSVDWMEIPYFFRFSDCLILPSISEPWGLVVNEAMVCGLAIISSENCGCVDDLIHENGYVFNPFSSDDLNNQMVKLIEDNGLLEKFKLESKKIIKDFNVNEVAKRILIGFENIMKNRLN